ncbi:hypothetical protein [Bordetella bronchiseptica]|uniref:hypothetical protein n=1 Tax=Bordetella bronchiseptica TaxID=518 RepID=UPI000460D3B7|nr:hypothetical protein [Bordetella bronchiseptica]KDC29286.1 hypothetical protein L504_2149 [Bordetella bronchiseptica F2]
MTATVQCVACERFTLRENSRYAALGFGRCALMAARPGAFVSPIHPRQCRDHQPAPEIKVEARIEWLRDLRSEGATC